MRAASRPLTAGMRSACLKASQELRVITPYLLLQVLGHLAAIYPSVNHRIRIAAA